MTIPTQLDPYPDIAGCLYPDWAGYKFIPVRIIIQSWLDFFYYFLTDNAIIKSRKSYIVGHFFPIPPGLDLYPAQ